MQTSVLVKKTNITSISVMISSDDESSNVVEAMRLGALDYLVKPLVLDKVMATIALAARTSSLERENRRLCRKLEVLASGQEMIGCSAPARRLSGVLRRVSESDATVLLEGAAGSGKRPRAALSSLPEVPLELLALRLGPPAAAGPLAARSPPCGPRAQHGSDAAGPACFLAVRLVPTLCFTSTGFA